MKLLVTTPKYVFTFDTVSEHLELIRGGDGEYYGISWTSKELVLSHTFINCEQLKTWHDYRNSRGGVISVTSQGKLQHSEEILLAPHQIECVGDRILVTNTGHNCISVFKTDGAFERHVHFNDISWDVNPEGKTGSHYNSVHMDKNFIYLVAHNHGRASEVYKLTWPELECIQIIKTKAKYAHNIWQCEHGTLICNSINGGLYDIETDDNVWLAPEKPIFVRGLAATKGYIFVGRSEFGKRSDRNRNTGGLWVLDRQTLKTLEVFKFPGSGCVNDIRLISEIDSCHNGVEFNPNWISLIKKVSRSDRYNYTKNRIGHRY